MLVFIFLLRGEVSVLVRCPGGDLGRLTRGHVVSGRGRGWPGAPPTVGLGIQTVQHVMRVDHHDRQGSQVTT